MPIQFNAEGDFSEKTFEFSPEETRSSTHSCADGEEADISPHSDPKPLDTKAEETLAAISFFEGPEKNLEIDFRVDVGHCEGLRALNRSQLDQICEKARCLILTKIENNHFDAYVLSESSLFVYKHKLILKTCGTTTLLRCIPVVLQFAKELGLEMEWLSYARKNYNFPDQQEYPHNNFSTEMKFLEEWFDDGHGYMLGPVTGDHWVMFVVDRTGKHATNTPECTFNLMMFDMDESVGEIFFKKNTPTWQGMMEKSGFSELLPDVIVDATAFDPCGFSMNGMLGPSYFTAHITPEKECSYASFETNAPVECHATFLKSLLTLFRPKRFTLTLCVDSEITVKNNPVEHRSVAVTKGLAYRRTTQSQTHFEGDYGLFVGNFCYAPQH